MKKIIFVSLFLFLYINAYSQLPKDDFSVIINETEISLGDRTKDVLTILGEVDYELYDNTYNILREYSYPWGKIYTSNADDGLVFGITSESEVITTKKGIHIGNSKEEIIFIYEKPYRIIENLNHYYYINYDFDVLELKFVFNTKDEVCFLSIFMGT